MERQNRLGWGDSGGGGRIGSKPTGGRFYRSPHQNHGPQGGRKSPKRGHGDRRSRSPKGKPRPPGEITVVVNRVDLTDCDVPFEPHHVYRYHPPNVRVGQYRFERESTDEGTGEPPKKRNEHSVVSVRTPPSRVHRAFQPNSDDPPPARRECSIIDNSFPNPFDPEKVPDRYWSQRRRLFSKFDEGVQLDDEGWYSVTPEAIANHVALRVGKLSEKPIFQKLLAESLPPSITPERRKQQGGLIVLDAFCGCGGNAIAFAKRPANQISLVVSVDIDRSKLRKAAYNACLYGIPKHKLVFVECSSIFIMEHCFANGKLCIDELLRQGTVDLPMSIPTEESSGFLIGGLGMLPRRIDAVFMDPPWGGVNYGKLGPNGYHLEKHMKIQRLSPSESQAPAAAPQPKRAPPTKHDDFFDRVETTLPANKFIDDKPASDGSHVNGAELVKIAANATSTNFVIYDVPRNTNKSSLGLAALEAGYGGNMKLEEHYVHGTLKTVTAYMGADFSFMMKMNLKDQEEIELGMTQAIVQKSELKEDGKEEGEAELAESLHQLVLQQKPSMAEQQGSSPDPTPTPAATSLDATQNATPDNVAQPVKEQVQQPVSPLSPPQHEPASVPPATQAPPVPMGQHVNRQPMPVPFHAGQQPIQGPLHQLNQTGMHPNAHIQQQMQMQHQQGIGNQRPLSHQPTLGLRQFPGQPGPVGAPQQMVPHQQFRGNPAQQMHIQQQMHMQQQQLIHQQQLQKHYQHQQQQFRTNGGFPHPGPSPAIGPVGAQPPQVQQAYHVPGGRPQHMMPYPQEQQQQQQQQQFHPQQGPK